MLAGLDRETNSIRNEGRWVLLETISTIVERVSSFLTRWTSIALALFMGGMVAVIVVAIVSRYLIKASVPWTEELARYLMVWAAFLGGSLGLKRGVHVGISFVVRKMPPRACRWVSLFTGLSLLFFFLVVIVEGCRFTMFVSRQLSPAMRLSMGWVYLALPTGGMLFAFYVVQFIVADINALVRRGEIAGNTEG